jgi:hypothetical protein
MLERLPCPIEAYGDVMHAQPEGCCDLLAGFAEQIYAPQDVRIVRFQRRKEGVETGAYRAFQFGGLPCQGLVLGIGGFLSSASRFSSGIVCQHRPEPPGEPREDTFTLVEVVRLADCTEVALL